MDQGGGQESSQKEKNSGYSEVTLRMLLTKLSRVAGNNGWFRGREIFGEVVLECVVTVTCLRSSQKHGIRDWLGKEGEVKVKPWRVALNPTLMLTSCVTSDT